jgi:hypothetical protein
MGGHDDNDSGAMFPDFGGDPPCCWIACSVVIAFVTWLTSSLNFGIGVKMDGGGGEVCLRARGNRDCEPSSMMT